MEIPETKSFYFFFRLDNSYVGSVMSQYSSALTNNSQTYCLDDPCQNTIYYYEAIQINVSISGNYIIWSNSSIDTIGYIYNNSFNPDAQFENLLLSDYDIDDNRQLQFAIMLQAMARYILVVKTYYSKVTGAFLIIANGPAPVNFIGA
jgi:hypothetical protein